ncbi:MAG: heterodisulfide reductase-related iron-sulfur binding cluster [bacterium]
MEATRPIYWNIALGMLIYGFAAVALGFAVRGIHRRIRLIRLGAAEIRTDRMAERIRGLVVEIFGHRRLLRDPVPGVAHLFVFYGFLVELVATGLIAVQEWTGIHFLHGPFYRGYSLVSDVFGVLGLVGCAIFLWRRGVQKVPRLHTITDDWIAIGLLGLVFAQGFVVEGLRIAATELRQNPSLAVWSPGGYLVAKLVAGLGEDALRALHRGVWWFHAATAFSFLGYMAYGKLNHVWFGTANILLRNLGPSGKLAHFDIDNALEADPDGDVVLGTSRIEQYPWKSLLDLDACMNCGRCEAVCPASLSGVPLSPRKLIQDMKAHLSDVGPASLLARLAQGQTVAGVEGAGTAAPAGDVSTRPPLFGEAPAEPGAPRPAVLEDELWGCRTCGACTHECPVFIEHIPKMVDMRRHLVMTDSKMSDAAQLFLKNMDDRMHPWAKAPHNRDEWYQDLDVKVLGDGAHAEYLYWVGCTGAMIDRNIQVTRAMVKVLKAAGVDFAILGSEEACTGDPARRVGGEFTFQLCAKQNIETLAQYGVRKIITTCPHCFNSYQNEYPDFGGNYEVVHHTQLIADLLRAGKLRLRAGLDALTYHDPCYLGRHNGVYEAPRAVLDSLAVPGGRIEMERSQSKSLCCGAGGGYAWMDDDPKTRINHLRLADVKECGAKTAAVSCPFCMQMFDDALKTLDPEKSIRAADIAELVAEALEA